MSSAPRILIFGAGGQLGRELQRSFSGCGEVVACDRASVDLTERDQIRGMVQRAGPDVILNAAAYTAVDKAETEQELAMAVNADAPRVMAEEAQRRNALLVHYSTDYVFDGSKDGPWVESDSTHPLNAYGASKLAGEEAIAQAGGRFLIFRTSWIYGPHGHNFLLTMLRLGRQRDELRIVDDQYGAPTSSIAIADATRAVVDLVAGTGAGEDWGGIYHMTCSGSVSWCGFAEAIFARGQGLLDGKAPRVAPIASSEYPVPARRPRNSVLCCDRLAERFGVRLPSWQEALDAVMAELAGQQAAG